MYINPLTQRLCNPLHRTKKIEVDVLRTDLLHPVVSGNKWFKLKYYITAARHQNKQAMVSFGGAFSNHLVAMAYACKENAMQSAAIIRGEDNDSSNLSIQEMKAAGMQLLFVSREAYRNKEQLMNLYLHSHPEFYYVPEGGQGELGVKGAAEILSYAKRKYTHILCAVGTGTTLAGLINASNGDPRVIGICTLKIPGADSNELLQFIDTHVHHRNYEVMFNYHFGGYAKKSSDVLAFMNRFYKLENIPSDFVYTGKMFYAADDLMRKDYFPEGSTVLLIHTGGLQGNRSLPAGVLEF